MNVKKFSGHKNIMIIISKNLFYFFWIIFIFCSNYGVCQQLNEFYFPFGLGALLTKILGFFKPTSETVAPQIRSIINWIDNQIPFVFHKSCNNQCQKLINETIRIWEKDTCIRFINWGNEDNSIDVDNSHHYIRFRADRPGCFTVKRTNQNSRYFGQSVNLGRGCFKKSKILHELGHVLNLEHVHGRPDRDLYISLIPENILKGFEDQYEKRINLTEKIPYDYRSIMHYDSSDFSESPFEKITMSTVNPNLQYLIDEPREGLSFWDVKQVNLMYNCSRHCSQELDCLNQGIAIERERSTCQCLCPPAFSGDRCEIPLYTKYQFDPMITRSGKTACGDLLKSEGLITTKDYPRRSQPYESCSWIINAPKGKRIEVYFHDFWFDEASTYLEYYQNRCVSERVEIRCKGIYKPKMYCGRQLNNTVIKSRSNYMVINVIAGPTMVGRGLKASFKFVP